MIYMLHIIYLSYNNIVYIQFVLWPRPIDERKKKLQQSFWTGLLVGNIFPAFRLLLTDVEYSQIEDKNTNIARVDELFKTLLTKNDWHFDEFCAILESNGSEHRARELRKAANGVDGKLIGYHQKW